MHEPSADCEPRTLAAAWQLSPTAPDAASYAVWLPRRMRTGPNGFGRLSDAGIDHILKMGWEDCTPFEAIKI